VERFEPGPSRRDLDMVFPDVAGQVLAWSRAPIFYGVGGMAEPRKPLAVLMSGAPGAGKTTLAHALGDRLRIPVIEKDRLRAGCLRTIGKESPSAHGPKLFYEVMEHLLGCRISVVGDMTLFPGISESDVAAMLAPVAELILVHCQSSDAVARFESRMRADPLNRSRVDELLPMVKGLQDRLHDPVHLDCPCIVVDTVDGYSPSLDTITENIERFYNDGPAGPTATP
jgi:predicted kinase